MKTILTLTSACILSIGSLATYAQQAPMYTHYMYNTLSVNPGYAGSRDALTITGLHRSQWVDFDGAPTTQTLTMHTPIINEHIGLGLSLMNDKIGPNNTTALFADFAYRMQLTKKSKLALGLSGGANIMQSNLSALGTEQINDPAFQNNVSNRVTPNFGFGAYYSMDRFYAGISAPNLLENAYGEDGNGLVGKEQRHYFFIAGAMFQLADNLAFKPTTLVKASAAVPLQADLTASFVIAERLLVGAMFRTGDAVGGLVGLDLTTQLHLGYSYDWSYGLKTPTYNKGSHEIVLRYDFLFFDKKQIHSPRYF